MCCTQKYCLCCMWIKTFCVWYKTDRNNFGGKKTGLLFIFASIADTLSKKLENAYKLLCWLLQKEVKLTNAVQTKRFQEEYKMYVVLALFYQVNRVKDPSSKPSCWYRSARDRFLIFEAQSSIGYLQLHLQSGWLTRTRGRRCIKLLCNCPRGKRLALSWATLDFLTVTPAY